MLSMKHYIYLTCLAVISLTYSCKGDDSTDNPDQEIVLPKIEFQTFNERISYCIGMDHAKGSYQVYNGPQTKGKFDNDQISMAMVDYITDNKLRVQMYEVDSILGLYLLPGGMVDEEAVSKLDASYAIGLSEAQYLVGSLVGRGIDQEIDVFYLAEGIKAGMKQDESVVKFNEARMEVSNYYNELTLEMGQSFLAANAERDSVVTTMSGLQYQIIEEGSGVKPNLTDSVIVHYTGMFIDGRAFESTVPSGRPGRFVLLGLIQGWQEGMQLMKEGAQYRFFIPYQLAYGEQGSGPIPPYSALVFDIELIQVKRFGPAS